MASPEGKGIARRAWEAYEKRARAMPGVDTLARKLATPFAFDLTGFWLLWHLEGGFEGLLRLGMSRSSIYRRISLFRRIVGVHPDEYQMPGVTLDLKTYAKKSAESVKSQN